MDLCKLCGGDARASQMPPPIQERRGLRPGGQPAATWATHESNVSSGTVQQRRGLGKSTIMPPCWTSQWSQLSLS
eukprot:9164829-Pyramimonas_sp.AAC.1